MELFKILLFNKNRFANNAFCVFVAIKIAVCTVYLHRLLNTRTGKVKTWENYWGPTLPI